MEAFQQYFGFRTPWNMSQSETSYVILIQLRQNLISRTTSEPFLRMRLEESQTNSREQANALLISSPAWQSFWWPSNYELLLIGIIGHIFRKVRTKLAIVYGNERSPWTTSSLHCERVVGCALLTTNEACEDMRRDTGRRMFLVTSELADSYGSLFISPSFILY